MCYEKPNHKPRETICNRYDKETVSSSISFDFHEKYPLL